MWRPSRCWWTGLLDAFPDYGAEVVEVRDVGDLTVAALRLRGRGAESNTLGRSRLAGDAVAGRECIRWRVYTSKSEALEAVGLSD
jgi:hypothetical protein